MTRFLTWLTKHVEFIFLLKFKGSIRGTWLGEWTMTLPNTTGPIVRDVHMGIPEGEDMTDEMIEFAKVVARSLDSKELYVYPYNKGTQR